MRSIFLSIIFLSIIYNGLAQDAYVSEVWVSDNGNGTYTNPIIHADYSDPDVVRVGDDYYMTASSFNCIPGLPILHSKDLVNWQLIGHGLKSNVPYGVYSKVQHGKGVYAPCIRYQNNEFHIYYPDPDFGIYLIKATNPKGPWTEPVLVKAGKGLIDPSPLWDEDGKVYLTFALAASRIGINSVLLVQEMNSKGTAMLGEEVMVFDGLNGHPTVEGPKFYKANGYYYIFAPAGGVSTGWQIVLRSKNVYGPYELKTVMAQGKTDINGPHQGAWVDTKTGEHWFIHFQDKKAYGRIVHLNPMTWKDGWPVIGIDKDGDGVGEPVLTYKKPNTGNTFPVETPLESDEFNGSNLGPQWQWHATKNLSYGFASGNLGYYRLNCIKLPEGVKGLWGVPNLLLQKFPAEGFTATTKLLFQPRGGKQEVGFVVMGNDYQYISLKSHEGKQYLRVVKCEKANQKGNEVELYSEVFLGSEIYFRITVKPGALCDFSFSTNGETFRKVGDEFKARPGQWIGAKVGFFAIRERATRYSGTADIDWFRITK